MRPSNRYFSSLNVPVGNNGFFQDSGKTNNENNNIIAISNSNLNNEVTSKYLSTNSSNNLMSSNKGTVEKPLNSNEVYIKKEKIDKITDKNSSSNSNKLEKQAKKENKLLEGEDKKDKTVGINNPIQINNNKPTHNKSESSIPAIKRFSNKEVVKVKDLLNAKK